VLTDSGGLQEETTALGVPCVTIRETTERPVTASMGTNEVVGTDPARILDAVDRILAGKWKKGAIPEGWDGKAGERIVQVLERYLSAPQA
jgi:UDP-N-acetylglucosamine 2-epimerase (non-hydrolysing)